MITLTNSQSRIVATAAAPLTVEKREIFRQRIVAELERIRRFDDAEVMVAVAKCVAKGWCRQWRSEALS